MDILHLTDLHVSEPNTSLDGIWTTAVRTLRAARREKFDFIVVSGDLTQRAHPDEYKRLAAFTERELVPRLHKPDDRRRIVFVPGNHDVDWATDVGKVFSRGVRPPKDEIEKYLTKPHESALRHSMRPTASVQFWRRIPEVYRQRFARVQNFFDEFYRGPATAPHRSFDLTSPEPGGHWSAHVFEEDGIAFFGFNTCFHNDKYWRGATLEETTVFDAVTHARAHADGLLWIAVWHHGLASDRGQPDHLITRDLGFLRANGFRVGIHGHTHADEFSDLRDVLYESFPVVATGSFAAGATDRPEGALNQFAVLEMGPSYLCVERFSRRPTTEWERTKQAPYVLRAATDSRPVPFNETDVHTRVFQLDLKNGFARVKIDMQELDLGTELVLAEPSGPYSNFVYDPQAVVDGALVDVSDGEGRDSRRRIKFASSSHIRSLQWSCLVSNVLARDRADLSMVEPSHFGQQLHKLGWQEYDWVAHDVRVHARTFTLSVEIQEDKLRPGGAIPAIFDPGAVGLRAFDENLVEDEAEGGRSKPVVNANGTSLSVTIRRPYVGYRYVVGYRPLTAGNPCPAATLTLITNAADALRACLPGDSIREHLTEGVEKAVRMALAVADSERIIWYGYLWHHGKRRLITAFGNAPWSAAAREFEYGRGVVGHSFRTCRPACYFADKGAKSLLITGDTNFDWIVAIPILLDAQGPAVGVLGFAGRDPRGWDQDLRDYAQRASRRADSDESDPFEDQLLNAATLLFWNELRHVASGLGRADYREFARIYDAWRARVPRQ